MPSTEPAAPSPPPFERDSVASAVAPPPPLPPPPPPQALDLPELERNRRTIASSRLSASHISTATPSIRSPFFQATLFLGVPSWIFGFVSQVIVAAQVSNGPVGTLWLAFILQTILIFWILTSLAFASPLRPPRDHNSTFAHLASMAAVLAAIGVDKNLYSHQPAQKAVAAGWLVTAIVDILWVIYFSSDENSAIRNWLGQSWIPPPTVGGDRISVLANGQQIGERTRGIGALSGKLPPLTSPSFKFRPARLRKAKRESTGSQPADIKIVEESSAKEGTVPSSEPAVEGDYNRLSAAHRSLSVNPGASSVAGDVSTDSRPLSSAPSGGLSAKGSAVGGLKAQALYDYDGSDNDPHELTFVKGDVFEITDQSGKWWEAVNKDGRIGIVPSNYVHLLE